MGGGSGNKKTGKSTPDHHKHDPASVGHHSRPSGSGRSKSGPFESNFKTKTRSSPRSASESEARKNADRLKCTHDIDQQASKAAHVVEVTGAVVAGGFAWAGAASKTMTGTLMGAGGAVIVGIGTIVAKHEIESRFATNREANINRCVRETGAIFKLRH